MFSSPLPREELFPVYYEVFAPPCGEGCKRIHFGVFDGAPDPEDPCCEPIEGGSLPAVSLEAAVACAKKYKMLTGCDVFVEEDKELSFDNDEFEAAV